MPKVFLSSVESSFFKYLSKIWDRLPQSDRDFLAEYWRGLIRATADEYCNYLQVEASSGILSINPYEVRKWRPIEIRKVFKFFSQEEDGLVFYYPTDKSSHYHLENGILRVDQNSRKIQSAQYNFDPIIENPEAFTFEFDIRFPSTDVNDEIIVGFFSGKNDGNRASTVGISFGRMSPQFSVKSESFITVGDYTVREGSEFVSGVGTGSVVGPFKFKVPSVNFSTFFNSNGENLVDLIKGKDKTIILEIVDPTTVNDGAFRVIGVESSDSANDTLLVNSELTVLSNLSFHVYEAKVGGAIETGFTNGNSESTAAIAPFSLRNLNLLGGQAAISVSAGIYSSVRLKLSTVTSTTPVALFNVYRSTTNFPGSYQKINASPLRLEPVGPNEYKLVFSDFGLKFSSGEWIKIRPDDPGTQYKFSDTFLPLRVVKDTQSLRTDWANNLSFSQFGVKRFLSDSVGVYSTINLAPINALTNSLISFVGSGRLLGGTVFEDSINKPFDGVSVGDVLNITSGSQQGHYKIVEVISKAQIRINKVLVLETDLSYTVTFDFFEYHRYRLDVTDNTLEVRVDGKLVYSEDYETSSPRSIGSFGIFTVGGGSGLKAFIKNVKFTQFNIDSRIAELPALYDRYELQTLVLENEKGHYSIADRGLLRFSSLDIRDHTNTIVGSIRDLDILIAEYVSYSLRRIESIYGQLVGITGEDSPKMKNNTAAVWSSLLDGPLIDSIRKGVSAFLGLPITMFDGFVTSDGSSNSFIDIDGIRFKFPQPVGVGINPRTRELYKFGDFVPAFSPVSGGVIVRDYLVKRDWWYGRLESGLFHELEKYHTFEVEIDDRLLTPGSAKNINAFLDRIRKIGDSFILVAKNESVEELVIEGNKNRTDLLQENSSRVFVGDSSSPAIICTPYVTTTTTSNTFGVGNFGGLGYEEALLSLPDFQGLIGLTTGGFGDPDDSFIDLTVLCPGSFCGPTTGTTGSTSTNGLDSNRNKFVDPNADFINANVSPGDYLLISNSSVSAQKGLYVIESVISSTEIRVSPSFGTFLGTDSAITYSIIHPTFSAGDVGEPFLFIGGYPIREASRIQIQADSGPEVTILIGNKLASYPGDKPTHTPEELMSYFYYSDGSTRIPGAFAYIEFLPVDTRDYSSFVIPPRRVCIRTISAKGHNSVLRLFQTDGSDDLLISTGSYRGHISYPGLEDVIVSGTFPEDIVSGDEPTPTPPTNETYGPYRKTERMTQLTIGGPGDPGLFIDADLLVNDGTTVRRDLQIVEVPSNTISGVLPPLRMGGLLNKPATYLPVGPGSLNYLETGQPYQTAFSGGSQFGTFYTDYVDPRPEYPLEFSDGLLIVPNRIKSSKLSLGNAVLISGNCDLFFPNRLDDSTADFTRVRIGDSVSIVGFGTTVVVEVASTTSIRIDPNLLTYPLITGHSSYAIKGLPSTNDYLFVGHFSLPPLSINRDTYPIYEGEVLKITSVFGGAVDGEITVERILDNGQSQNISFSENSTFTMTGKIVRSPLPYSLNPIIPQHRVDRVNKGYTIFADDLRFLIDSVDIITLP